MTHRLTAPVLKLAILISLIALVPLAIIIAATNQYGPLQDGGWYMRVATELRAGHGYVGGDTWPWPGVPTNFHAPLWPFLASLVLRCLPNVSPMTGMHLAGLLMHWVTILTAALLTWTLSGSRSRMFFAALIVSLWPAGIAAIIGGMGETCVGAVLTAGTLLLVSGGKRIWVAVCVLSLLPLERVNFLILPLFVVAALVVVRSPWRSLFGRRNPALLLMSVLLFSVPALFWVARNYLVMGAFPVLPGNPGTTFYGSWNQYTTSGGHGFIYRFGGWTAFPPGEDNLAQKASKGFTELGAERYYMRKGLQFVRTHWSIVPAAVIGHFGRLLLPAFSAAPGPKLRARYQIPEWICRLILYGAAMTLLLGKRPWSLLSSWFGLMLSATALTIALTTALLYGEQRFLFPLTILLIPFVCAAEVGPDFLRRRPMHAPTDESSRELAGRIDG